MRRISASPDYFGGRASPLLWRDWPLRRAAFMFALWSTVFAVVLVVASGQRSSSSQAPARSVTNASQDSLAIEQLRAIPAAPAMKEPGAARPTASATSNSATPPAGVTSTTTTTTAATGAANPASAGKPGSPSQPSATSNSGVPAPRSSYSTIPAPPPSQPSAQPPAPSYTPTPSSPTSGSGSGGSSSPPNSTGAPPPSSAGSGVASGSEPTPRGGTGTTGGTG